MSTKRKVFDFSDALEKIRPGAEWILRGEDYSGLEWLDSEQDKPSEKELKRVVEEMQQDWDNYEYSRQRRSEYPDILEYIDGVVKGDQSQIDSYIEKCLAVKEKYPKPEE